MSESVLRPGSRLGPYEVGALLDSGGMGSVYRARDPRLGRDVAIKVMRGSEAAEPDRLRRFETEARAAGALGHPNILVVYDVGRDGDVPYLVSELLDGQTLRQYLSDAGAVSPRKSLDWAAQIAAGLAAAHAKGIVHRDLKPNNLFVTREGRIKILDFGLAKLARPTGDGSTVTSDGGTENGVVLGTVGYMSPEQVRGQPAGPQADIFALGIVLHEMLSGASPFARETTAESLTAILRDDPPELPAPVPPAIRRLVRRCLEKRPEDRFQSAHDLGLAIEAIGGAGESSAVFSGSSRLGSTESTGVSARSPDVRPRLPWQAFAAAVAVAAVLTATAVGVWFQSADGSRAEATYLTALLPPGVSVASGPGVHLPLALSPDGRTLVIAAGDASGRRLYQRALGRLEATPIDGTEGALGPFFSPDGRWVGFFADRHVKRVPLSGGTAVDITAAPGFPAGAVWGTDDRIIIASGARSPLRVVHASGGTAEPLTAPTEGTGHMFPELLPDGRTLLFNEGSWIRALDLDSRTETNVVEGTLARYSTSGHLILNQGTTLLSAPFDARRLVATGPFQPVLDGIAVQLTASGVSQMAVSPGGVLAYVPAARGYALVLVEPDGTERTLGEDVLFENPRFSPDGSRLVVAATRRAGERPELWVYDLERGAQPSRLTSDGGRAPVWTRDGTAITYSYPTPGERLGIYSRAADGSGDGRTVVRLPAFHWLVGWTKDGTTLAYGMMEEVAADGVSRSSILALEGDASRRVVGPGDTWGGRLSPDGRYLAYYSLESGYFEVYVTPFPDAGTRWLIADGTDPAWSPRGDEVYYRSGNRLMAARIDAAGAIRVLSRRVVIEPFSPPLYDDYDISPRDGRTLALVRPSGDSFGRGITLVLDWFADLRRMEAR